MHCLMKQINNSYLPEKLVKYLAGEKKNYGIKVVQLAAGPEAQVPC